MQVTGVASVLVVHCHVCGGNERDNCRWCLSGFSGSVACHPCSGGRKQQCPFCEDMHWGGTWGQPLGLEKGFLLVVLWNCMGCVLDKFKKFAEMKNTAQEDEKAAVVLFKWAGMWVFFSYTMFGSLNHARRGFLSTKCILAGGSYLDRFVCCWAHMKHPLWSSLLFFPPPNATQSCLLFVCL